MSHARLLDIAIAEFGEKGLTGASTREIARAAGTAMSAITYHYGGKDGLYLAAAERIADEMAALLGGVVRATETHVVEDPAEARARMHRILSRLAEKLAEEARGGWPSFILREQMNPTAAFDRIYDRAMGPMLEAMAQLVCVATGMRDARAARIAALTMMAQVVSLRGSRASCLRLLGIERFAAEDIDAIKTRVAANTDAILDRLIAEQKGLA